MDEPLGFAVGNANEVEESLCVLRNPEEAFSRNGRMVGLCVELAATMVSFARGVSLEDAREECKSRLGDGSALAKFEAMVRAHGGDLDASMTSS